MNQNNITVEITNLDGKIIKYTGDIVHVDIDINSDESTVIFNARGVEEIEEMTDEKWEKMLRIIRQRRT